MPICFKCGKNLSTDQSLQYHLNRRVKCNTLHCDKCDKQFQSKLSFDSHLHECDGRNISTRNRHKLYDNVKSERIFLIEINKENKITYISTHFLDKLHDSFINQHIFSLITDDTKDYLESAIQNTEDSVSLNFRKILCDTILTRTDNGHLLTNTLIT